MKKKVLSILLTFAMVLSMATMFVGTVSASTAVDLSDGIDHYADLEAFIASLATKDYANETVTLNANITVNEGWVANDGTANAVAQPAGDAAKILDTLAATNAFAGIFDGQNHTISGLYMTGAAFFPAINGATVKNVTFDNCASVPQAYDSGKNCAGIVAGRFNDSDGTLVFENVDVKNSKIVNGTTSGYIGTFLGRSEETSGAVSFTDCQSMNCNLYSGAKTSLIGGIVGVLNAVTEGATFLRCSSDTDIVAQGGDHTGYKCGGIIGSSAAQVSITNCVNNGNITSQTYAGGMVGDASTSAVTIDNCVNNGEIKAIATSTKDGGAGGMLGRINNAPGCSITNSINFGKVSASTTGTVKNLDAGGMIALATIKKHLKTVEINNCLNQAEIESGSSAGGAIGRLNSTAVDSGKTDLKFDMDISNFVNTGDVTAKGKAGGLVGRTSAVRCGTIEKVITVGLITGYNTSSAPHNRAGCAIFGHWEEKNADFELNVIDFYYSNGGNQNIWGLNQPAANSTTRSNYYAKYTVSGNEKHFVAGVDNANLEEDSIENNLALYNAFFVANGYAGVASDFYAEKGANTFKAFNLGVDWMLTDTVPVPASVFALMEEKELEEKAVDYVGYQANAGSELTSIRVITGLNSIESYSKIGFELYLVEAKKDAVMADKNSTTVYTSLNVYDENGNALDPYRAETAGYEYLSAITVTGLDALGDVTTLIVKPYVMIGEEKVYGDSCAIMIKRVSGVLTVVDQYVL